MPIYLLPHSASEHQLSKKAHIKNPNEPPLLASIPHMASLQCYQPLDQYYESQSSVVDSQTECTTKTNAYYADSGLAKTHTAQCYSQTQTTNPNHNLGYGNYNSHFHSHPSGYGYTTGTDSIHTRGYGYGTGSTLALGGLGHGLTHTHGSTHVQGHGLTHTHGSGLGLTDSCNGVTASGRHSGRRGEHKRRSLFHKRKDGLSGDNSCSSSDSESDDEHCETGTRMFFRPNC